jgi:hypothetical protein
VHRAERINSGSILSYLEERKNGQYILKQEIPEKYYSSQAKDKSFQSIC